MTVIQRTPNLGIGIRMRRVSAAPAAAAAPGPDPTGETPVWVGMGEDTAIVVHTLEEDVCNQYPVGVWTGAVAGLADVEWSAVFTPVITARESMEGPATEVWRGSAVALVVPPVPVGGHPYPPTYFTIPNPLEIFGFEYEPTAYWTNAWLWTRLFVTGSGSTVALAGPSVFVSNGVLIVSTWGRCMSGELVATATRGGVELGQLSLTLVAENFLG